MDYDSLKTARDDVVRDGADFEAYRRPGALIDSDHPKITDYASRVAGKGSDREKALRLYYAVRDGLLTTLQHAMKHEEYLAARRWAQGWYCGKGRLRRLWPRLGVPARALRDVRIT